MKRNEYGINFDEGLPFESDWEFQKLYVPFHDNQIEEFINWLKNSSSPILIGGQIGSGKSTFINKVLKDCKISPDIIFHFDTEGENLSEGDFLKILMVGVTNYALTNKIDLTFSKLPQELTDNKIEKWDDLIKKLSMTELSLENFGFRKFFSQKLLDNLEYVIALLNKIVEKVENNINKELLFFASGIDKYWSLSAGFHSLQSSIDFLSKRKTIFEANALHLFENKWSLKNAQKIFLGTFEKEKVIELLKKRKGIYANSRSDVLENISYFSGGNPRQALRLLVNYEFYKNKKLTIEESLHFSIRKTIQDLFAYADAPSNKLIGYIEKEKSLSATLLTLTGDKDTAQKALYDNWIFIIEKKEGNTWNAKVNPIVTLFFKNDFNPEDQEMLLLKKYAENEQMSPSGMNFQVINDDNWLAKVKLELTQASAENYKLNLTDTLDLLTSSLLSNSRQDRFIIAYRSNEIMKIFKAFAFSKVFSFDNPTIIDYEFNNSETLVFQLNKILTQNKVSIYSFTFGKDFPDEQIIEVDKIRDSLIFNKILWWIPLEFLSRYLQKWTQLRQLFQIIILEDEIINVLSIQQIEEDIKFYEKVKVSDSSVLKNLHLVLEYLKIHGGN